MDLPEFKNLDIITSMDFLMKEDGKNLSFWLIIQKQLQMK